MSNHSRKNHRMWLRSGAVLTAAGLLSAFSIAATSGRSPAATPRKITLSIGGWPAKTNKSGYVEYQAYTRAFEHLYPNVKVVPDSLTWWSDGAAPFYAAAAAGQLPNFNTVPFTDPGRMISQGYAIPINNELKQAGWLKYLNPTYLKLTSKNGKIYGIPDGAYTMGLLVNIAVFKKAGLMTKAGLPEFPKTWTQLAQDAVIIKKKTGAVGFFFPTIDNQGGWQFDDIAWSYGMKAETFKNGKWYATFDDPGGVKALQYLKNLRWKYHVLEPNILETVNNAEQLAGTNNLGMYLGTPGYQNTSIQNYHMAVNGAGEGEMPGGPRGVVAQTGGAIVMFAPKTSPAQVMAGIHWLAITGFSPFTTKSVLQGFKEGLITSKKLGLAIGPQNTVVWKANTPIVKAENKLNAQYTNVTMGYWNNYLNHDTQHLHAEPKVDAQEYYAVMDGAIQKVLTDKSANPAAVLKKAAQDFQSTYLNPYNAQNGK